MTKKQLTYNEAIQEIEKILLEIENNEIELDSLTEKVNRVAFLLETCKNKLTQTEEQIEKIFEKNL
jgi:exodeoxyribonuclease VII small subunit